MLTIQQRRLAVALQPDEARQIQQDLQARFNALLHRVRLEYLQRLGLGVEDLDAVGPGSETHLMAGEIFMPEPGTIYYIKVPRDQHYLEAGAITRSPGRDVEEFFAEVREAVLMVHEAAGDWQPVVPPLASLDIDDARPGEVDISEQRLAASRALMDEKTKELLELIHKSGSTFFNKLEVENRDEAEGRIRHLEELGLVSKDFAVLCRKTNQQILRVASRASIEDQKAFKCFICGSPISQELFDEILTCSDLGRELLQDNHWLLTLVQGTLGSMGIQADDLRVYESKGAPVQIFLNFSQQHFLLVLLTRRLTLDQAYLINAHLAAHRLPHAILISAQRLSTLMRNHLVQSNPNTSFSFIDSLENLDRELQSVLLGKQRQYLRQILEPLGQLTPVRVSELVLRKMAPEPEAAAPRNDRDTVSLLREAEMEPAT